MRILVLLDDQPGNRNQSLGVAERLAEEAGAALDTIEIRGTKLADLPSFALGAQLWGYDGESRRLLRQRREAPDAILATGRRLIPALRHLKKRFPEARSIYLMHPQTSLSEFDLVAIPDHDRPPVRPNVIATIGAAHRVRAERLRAEGEPYKDWDSPRIAVLVGGKAKGVSFLSRDWMRLGAQLTALMTRTHGSLLVTTSRRTGPQGAKILHRALPPGTMFHAWKAGGANPYNAMLGAADAVVVTGESMSMLSEACALGVPVFVFNPKLGVGRKHKRLQKTLIERGYLRKLTVEADLNWAPPAALDEAGRVATAIRQLLR